MAIDFNAGIAIAHAAQLDAVLVRDLHAGQAAQRVDPISTVAKTGEVVMVKHSGVRILVEQRAVGNGYPGVNKRIGTQYRKI